MKTNRTRIDINISDDEVLFTQNYSDPQIITGGTDSVLKLIDSIKNPKDYVLHVHDYRENSPLSCVKEFL